VAYSGDDERFEYVYKFVSSKRMRRDRSKAARAHNKTLLTDGDLYVARFTGDSPAAEITGTGLLPSDGAFDGGGEWLPLVKDGVSRVAGMSVAEVLVFTRLAADKVGATKMDRPEDIEPNPATGKVYLALTNNSNRGRPGFAAADEANPRTPNREGHVPAICEFLGRGIDGGCVGEFRKHHQTHVEKRLVALDRAVVRGDRHAPRKQVDDLVLVLAVYLGVRHHGAGGAFGAFLLGYFLDTFSGTLLGVHAFAPHRRPGRSASTTPCTG